MAVLSTYRFVHFTLHTISHRLGRRERCFRDPKRSRPRRSIYGAD